MLHGFPEAAFFLPAGLKAWRFERRVLDRAFGAPNVLHVTHARCLDGAACDILARLRHGRGVGTIFADPHETADVLELLVDVPSRARTLLISDLSLQRGEGDRVARSLAGLAAAGWRVEWRDHHHKQWEGIDLRALAGSASVEIDFTGRECGATLVQRALLPDDAFAAALAATVRDHDLWLRQDPRSQVLFDALVEAGTERFSARLLARRRLDDPLLDHWAGAERRRKGRLVASAVAGARIRKGDVGAVGVAYGRVPTNEVLHSLEGRGADLSVLLKPDGTFSLRSRKGMEICHEIAQAYGGGGHPNASGGKLPLTATQFLPYWLRGGRHPVADQLVSRAVAAVDARARLAAGSAGPGGSAAPKAPAAVPGAAPAGERVRQSKP